MITNDPTHSLNQGEKPMKHGADIRDQENIKRLTAGGHTAKEISEVLRIDEKCVASFMPEQPKKKKAKKADEGVEPDAAA